MGFVFSVRLIKTDLFNRVVDCFKADPDEEFCLSCRFCCSEFLQFSVSVFVVVQFCFVFYLSKMVERIEITNENIKDDDELELLLGEIPHATSSLTHHHHHPSHVNDNGYEPVLSQTMNGMMYDLPLSNGLYPSPQNEDSLIIHGETANHVRNSNKVIGGFRGQNKKCSLHEKRSQVESNHSQFTGANRSFPTPVRCKTLADARGYIYLFSKDQNGCRYIQSVFDEGDQEHVQMVFDEIVGHVAELMVNPFGNYLMQKLLEVCNEEQRMLILMEVTREPRELVQISLNTHGTRVVQKLIETLKTRKQIKVVISALEPGFLALIKDLNGNHVIQRCLQCLSNEDNKFIFEAAAKYCVDIATHQHGCCVLQRCINHSIGKHQESLVLEISSNGLLLAQDAFGNYVVQSILELQIPSAVSMLTSQFEGNYVHLATQKFSSHVVEKCLSVLDDRARSSIIRELLSASHFEQLLQDPHANYVVQTALRVAEGSLHNLLVKAIESHKAISRNSPYSKRIFSHKLLKK
ncbi:hypothetical protein L1887_40063 [Cichorium endivia]|nr:hypothetical protein L1887_40063 [Cichorium endivia]